MKESILAFSRTGGGPGGMDECPKTAFINTGSSQQTRMEEKKQVKEFTLQKYLLTDTGLGTQLQAQFNYVEFRFTERDVNSMNS